MKEKNLPESLRAMRKAAVPHWSTDGKPLHAIVMDSERLSDLYDAAVHIEVLEMELAAERAQSITLQHHAADMAQRVSDLEMALDGIAAVLDLDRGAGHEQIIGGVLRGVSSRAQSDVHTSGSTNRIVWGRIGNSVPMVVAANPVARAIERGEHRARRASHGDAHPDRCRPQQPSSAHRRLHPDCRARDAGERAKLGAGSETCRRCCWPPSRR